MRHRWFLPIALTILLALAFPALGSHTATYTIRMLPPSGSSGQSVTLTCGYHGGSCGSTSGYFLDWDNTSTYYVYFRGIFARSGSSYETNRLVGKRTRISGGSDFCDVQDVKVVEKSTGKIRGVMRYFHISMNSTSDFPIATSGSGVYNAKYIGSIVNDSGCGAWSGTHVHAGYTSEGSASRSRNTSRFPTGDYCDPTRGTCRTFSNTSTTNWTHRFTWTGP